MKARLMLAAVAALGLAAQNAGAATVTFQENLALGYVDVFYTVSDGGEFLNWDLTATPTTGSILDPNTAQRGFNTQGGAAPLDTFANTVFSAVSASAASYQFVEYNPGQAFPPVAADPVPTPGAVAPAPDQLRWSIFDTNTGDGNIVGFFPYHMARVMYTPGTGTGTITAKFFDTTNATTDGQVFSTPYGAPIPEPATIAMGGMGLIGMIAVARRRRK